MYFKFIFVIFISLALECQLAVGDCMQRQDGNDNIVTKNLTNGCVLMTVNCTEDEEQSRSHYLYSGYIHPSEYFYPLVACKNITNISKFTVTDEMKEAREIVILHDSSMIVSVSDLTKMKSLQSLRFQSERLVLSVNATARMDLKKLSFTNFPLPNGIPNVILSTFPNLTSLDLTRNDLMNIKPDDFKGLTKLQTLVLSHNPIKSFNMSWISHLDSLTSLTMRRIGLKEIPQELTSKPNQLQFLDLSDNNITMLVMKSFKQMTELRTVLLANNKIKNIPNHFFKAAPSTLQYVDMSSNQIERIKYNILTFLSSTDLVVSFINNPIHCDETLIWIITWLTESHDIGWYPDIRMRCYNPAARHNVDINDLTVHQLEIDNLIPFEDCNITSYEESFKQKYGIGVSTTKLPPTTQPTTSLAPTAGLFDCPIACDCFATTEDYTKSTSILNPRTPFPSVDCSNRSKTSIPNNLPANTASLIMKYNDIETFDISQLAYLQNLSYLDLKDNFINNIIPASPNVTLGFLRYLSLSGNRITNVNASHLIAFPNLKDIYLNNNQIQKFPDDLFSNQQNILRLFLGPNPLSGNIKGSLFKHLPLVTLELNGVGFKKFPDFMQDMPSLLRIDLNDNDIPSIPSHAFNNCSSMKRIRLAHNKISIIANDSFVDLMNLEELDLTENKLTTIPKPAFARLTQELTTLELWRNELVCDCNLAWIVDWISLKSKDNPAVNIRFECSSPSRVTGRVSNEMKTEDFVCVKEPDVDSKPIGNPNKTTKDSQSVQCKKVKDGKFTITHLIIAIIVTLIVGFVMGILTKTFCCNRCRRHKEGYANLIQRRFRNDGDDAEDIL